MIVVTGGAGFIGSNIIKKLNEKNQKNILLVDDLRDGTKYCNINDLDIADYCDKSVFIEKIKNHYIFPEKITAIIHQGACSDTTEMDGHYVMENNYEYSKILLHYCIDQKIPFLYASSAAVYGNGLIFDEKRENENPINMYAYSKWQFDQYVRRLTYTNTQIVGLRYFNVYGPREQHKNKMASVAFHLHNQIKKEGVARLFEGCDGYDDGEQRRDFVFIDDVVNVNLWLLENKAISGIFNVGTGRAQSFNDVAKAVINTLKKGSLQYVPFPEHLKGRYQSFTEANITQLRNVGYPFAFKTVEEGVAEYMQILMKA